MRLLHTAFVVIWLLLTSQHAVAQQNYNKEYGNIIRTMSVERMRITSSGLVGIGTATPTTAFQVSGSVMFTSNSTSAPALYISNSTGYVGIGTNSPQATLHVSGGLVVSTTAQVSYNPSLYISTNGFVGVRDIISNSSFAFGVGSNIRINNSQNGNAGIYIFRDGAAGTSGTMSYGLRQTDKNSSGGNHTLGLITQGSERVTVDSNGLVGIGTLSPTTKLEVNGTISATSVSVSTHVSVTGNFSAAKFIGDGSQLTGIVASSAATDRISTSGVASGATLGAVVADRGTVSFTLAGTAGAAYLHSTLGFVGPGVSTTGPVSATNLYSSGDIVWIGEAYDVSDRRMKENIQAFADGTLARLEQLKPVSFRMISGSGRTEYGFIAQDVEPVFPELVKPGTPYTLNMVGMIAPTIKAVQELAAENRALRQTVASQATRIQTLEAANDNFERRLRALEADKK